MGLGEKASPAKGWATVASSDKVMGLTTRLTDVKIIRKARICQYLRTALVEFDLREPCSVVLVTERGHEGGTVATRKASLENYDFGVKRRGNPGRRDTYARGSCVLEVTIEKGAQAVGRHGKLAASVDANNS
jgi:hypothetical protein